MPRKNLYFNHLSFSLLMELDLEIIDFSKSRVFIFLLSFF